jgi:hypothetical protein
MVAEDVSAGPGLGASKSLHQSRQSVFEIFRVYSMFPDQGGTPDDGSRERYKDAA